MDLRQDWCVRSMMWLSWILRNWLLPGGLTGAGMNLLPFASICFFFSHSGAGAERHWRRLNGNIWLWTRLVDAHIVLSSFDFSHIRQRCAWWPLVAYSWHVPWESVTILAQRFQVILTVKTRGVRAKRKKQLWVWLYSDGCPAAASKLLTNEIFFILLRFYCQKVTYTLHFVRTKATLVVFCSIFQLLFRLAFS